MGFRQLWNEGQEHAMELKLADNPTIEIVSEKAFLDALEKTNADALETLSEKQEEYKRIWSTARSVGRDFHGLTDGQKKAFDLVKEGKNVLCRRAGHPCRKRRSKRVRRPWRRDVLRRGNRLVQGFPRSVRDCCSEDGFGPHESLHHHRSRKSNESHPHRPCRIISSHHTHHTNDAQSDRHPTTTETSNAVGLLAN